MTTNAPSLTLGIEEEYFLVDRDSGALAAEMDPAFLDEAKEALGERMSVELFQSEFEIGTDVCPTIADARQELRRLRRTVADVAGRYGMAPIAASSHPFSSHLHQKNTETDRYRGMAEDYQAIADRAVVVGMHVHLGVEDDDARIDVMNRVTSWLPLLLALSTSSPFWQGRATGLKAIRSTIFGEFPRTGIPDRFRDFADWQAFVGLLAETELLPDPSKLWWDIRPSVRLPTVEMRIADTCTRLEDALTIAALYQALAARLARTETTGRGWHRFQRALVEENKWRAQRHGIEARFGDFDRHGLIAVPDLVDRLVDDLAGEAERLGSTAEIENARRIVRDGTSADVQLRIHEDALAAGASPTEAGQAVVRWLIETTAAGTADPV